MTYLLIGLALAALIALLGAVNTPTIKGVTTIVWGTKGDLTTPLDGLIAESISYKPKNTTGLGEIENGDGAAVIDVLLNDGFDATVTAVYDSSKTYPAEGAAVTINKPISQGAGGSQAYVGYLVGDPEISKSRKKEATITLIIRYRPGITP